MWHFSGERSRVCVTKRSRETMWCSYERIVLSSGFAGWSRSLKLVARAVLLCPTLICGGRVTFELKVAPPNCFNMRIITPRRTRVPSSHVVNNVHWLTHTSCRRGDHKMVLLVSCIIVLSYVCVYVTSCAIGLLCRVLFRATFVFVFGVAVAYCIRLLFYIRCCVQLHILFVILW